jgi:hypothetical protein
MYIDRKVPYSIREQGKDIQYRRKETSPRNKSRKEPTKNNRRKTSKLSNFTANLLKKISRE